MSLHQAVASQSSARVQALREKHKNLSQKIEEEQSRSFISEHILKNLKREKLKLKEQIEGLRDAS